MPTNVDYDVNMTVSIDGVVDSSYSKKINPKYNSSYAMSFTGSGSATVLVMLDGQNYRKYEIDYATGNYKSTSYAFVPTEPETTQPTEAPTSESEPVTEPESESVSEEASEENLDEFA